MRACFALCVVLGITVACTDDETDDATSSTTTTQSATTGPGAGGMGTGGTSTGGTGGSCTSAAPFELTSPAVEEMGLLPVQYKCDNLGGTNISPPLTWTPGPTGTLSYAIIFRDLTGGEFLHSAIWDIPACVFELPEDVEHAANPAEVPGAKQCASYGNGPYGYAGPCALGFEAPRMYQFEAFAIGTAALPGITPESTLAQVLAAMEQNSVASDTLTVIEDDP